MRRRTFLKTATAAALGGSVVSRALAATYDGQPDHVTLQGTDTAPQLLDQYRPRLVLRDVEITPEALYAWRATSSEYQYDWFVYFAYYVYQEGISAEDSHFPDREPVYVGVNDDGEIAKVVYDQYHYLAGTTLSPALDDDGRPLLQVIEPWHPYTPTTELGQLVEIADLHDRYQPWLDTGWGVDPESVVDPPRVVERGHWWDDDQTSLRMTAWLSAQWFQLNQQLPIELPLPGRET
jgi:hypothetical protein